MKQRTLVPDSDEMMLDQLTVEDNCRLVMVLRATGEARYWGDSKRVVSIYSA